MKHPTSLIERLPFHILLQVMGESMNISSKIIKASPRVGRATISGGFSSEVKKMFTVRGRHPSKWHGGETEIYYTLNGRLHREEGPAEIRLKDKVLLWFRYGEYDYKRTVHRMDMYCSSENVWAKVWTGSKMEYVMRNDLKDEFDFWYGMEVKTEKKR
jgi:hypothetical protein